MRLNRERGSLIGGELKNKINILSWMRDSNSDVVSMRDEGCRCVHVIKSEDDDMFNYACVWVCMMTCVCSKRKYVRSNKQKYM